jgi:hypothetical protein
LSFAKRLILLLFLLGGFCAATAIPGKIFISGGNNGGTGVTVFDTATNAMTSFSMTTDRYSHASVAVGTLIVFAGGSSAYSVEVYDSQSTTFLSTLSLIPLQAYCWELTGATVGTKVSFLILFVVVPLSDPSSLLPGFLCGLRHYDQSYYL